MSGTAGEEHANLHTRGVNEAASGAELDAQEVLDVLDVFGEDGVRMYLVGFLEGIEDRLRCGIWPTLAAKTSVGIISSSFSIPLSRRARAARNSFLCSCSGSSPPASSSSHFWQISLWRVARSLGGSSSCNT